MKKRPYLSDFVAGPLYISGTISVQDLRIATQLAIDSECRKHLRERVSPGFFAEQIGLNKNALSDFMCGRRGPPPQLLELFGLERVTHFQRPKSEQ